MNSPGETELQGLLQVLPQAFLGTLRLGVAAWCDTHEGKWAFIKIYEQIKSDPFWPWGGKTQFITNEVWGRLSGRKMTMKAGCGRVRAEQTHMTEKYLYILYCNCLLKVPTTKLNRCNSRVRKWISQWTGDNHWKSINDQVIHYDLKQSQIKRWYLNVPGLFPDANLKSEYKKPDVKVINIKYRLFYIILLYK